MRVGRVTPVRAGTRDKRRAEHCPPYRQATSDVRDADVRPPMFLRHLLCNQIADARLEASRDL
jgi:hypothetical protein